MNLNFEIIFVAAITLSTIAFFIGIRREAKSLYGELTRTIDRQNKKMSEHEHAAEAQPKKKETVRILKEVPVS